MPAVSIAQDWRGVANAGHRARSEFKPSEAVSQPCELSRARASAARKHQTMPQKTNTSLVRKKSAIKMVIEIATTVFVVLRPTPAVPPRVVMPK